MRIYLPSINTLLTGAFATFKRFPLTLISALIGTVNQLLIIDLPYEESDPLASDYNRNLMVSFLGLTIFTALTLYSEHRKHIDNIKYGIQLAFLALLIIYRVTIPDTFLFIDIFRFSMYCLAAHLLVSFLPFVGRSEPEAFWSYNKSLFLRILLAALYTLVLWAGLSVAILSIDQLFNADIDGDNYFKLFVVLAGIFNTWFFLAGVPDLRIINDSQEVYPKGLKIFTQYVLIPLITVYLFILYAYIIKIVITQTWPDGWVSWLVLSFSVAGILSLLLIWPVRNLDENNWIKIYSRGFYYALFPLVILLFLSIRIRIQDYGITEARYYVVVLASWLACVAAYFLFSRVRAIKVIPVSLFVVALLSVHGPWSSFSISKNSQLNRFLSYIEKNNLIKNGKIIAANDTIPSYDNLQISETVSYLNEYSSYRVLQPYFNQNLDSLMKKDSVNAWIDKDQRIMQLINIEMLYNYSYRNNQPENYYYRLKPEQILDISGYDYYMTFMFWNPNVDSSLRNIKIGSENAEVRLTGKGNLMIIKFTNDTLIFDIEKHFTELIKKQSSGSELHQDILSIKSEGNFRKGKLIFRDISGPLEKNEYRLTEVNLDIFIGSK